MEKKQVPVGTVVGPYGSENRSPTGFWGSDGFFFVSTFPVNFGQHTGMKLWPDLEEMKKKWKNMKKNKNRKDFG